MFTKLRSVLASAVAIVPELSSTEKQVAAWREKVDNVAAELAKARTHQTEVTIAAVETHDTEAIEDARRHVAALTSRLEILQQTLDAAQQRLASEREQLQRHREREAWQAFEQALAERRKALVALVKSTEGLAKTLADAEAAAERAFQLNPARDQNELPPYVHLEHEMRLVLSYVSDFKFGAWKGDYSTGYEARKGPGLIERADADAQAWLRKRPRDDQAA